MMIDLELIDLVKELYCWCDYFETYFMSLDLFLLLDLFYVAHLPYFAINYNVQFDNLLIILFFTNLFATYSFIYFYDKSNIVFF